MSRLFHRLSLRRKNRPRPNPELSATKPAPLSCPDLSHCLRSSDSYSPKCEPKYLEVLSQCLKHMDNVFYLVRLRVLNRDYKAQVDGILASVTKMDVRRVRFDELYTDEKSSTRVVAGDKNDGLGPRDWHLHPAGYRIGVRMRGNLVEVLVDESWTSKEINILCGLMKSFRPYLTHITLDAPIVELVIASLSLLDLDRWYAFQCFLQAVDDPQLHISFQNLSLFGDRHTDLFWPHVQQLIIRTNERDSVHLARLLDYGVRSHCVLNPRVLNELRVRLEGTQKLNRSLNRNLYHFRCWAGSAGFDHRFSQDFAINTM